MKNPMTPAGIEPATFQFVTQHLNHCTEQKKKRLKHVVEIYRIYYILIRCIFLNIETESTYIKQQYDSTNI